MYATLTSLDARELASLRRRAYGPDADIDSDPAALRRLNELEARVHTQSLHDVEDPTDAAPPRPDVREPTASIPPPRAPAVTTDEPEAPLERPRWLRPIAWLAVAALVLAGAIIAPRIGALVAARPDATLAPLAPGDRSASVQSLTPDQARAYFSIETDSLLKYESFHGVEVWVARSDLGSRCLLLLAKASLLGINCTPGGLDPSIDLTMFGGREAILGPDLPNGSVVRFVSHDDQVDVWISVASESA